MRQVWVFSAAVWIMLAGAAGLQAAVVYVKAGAPEGGDGQSWATAYKYLQDALTAARNSGGTITEIWVAAGTYQPDRDAAEALGTGDRTATFSLISGVALRGGFAGNEDPTTFNLANRNFAAHASILSGDLAGNDGPGFVNMEENSYHVVTGNGTNNTATLDGFVIQSGNGVDNDVGSGGGILVGDGSLKVVHCRFTRNYAFWGGACSIYSGNPPEISACIFEGNRVEGGGGAIEVYSSNLKLRDCVFVGNVAGFGGAIAAGDNLTLSNCTFAFNDAYRAGVLETSYGTTTVANCVFWGNTSTTGTAADIGLPWSTATLTVQHSDIQGGQEAVFVDLGSTLNWGAGNIDADPLFVRSPSPGSDEAWGTEDDDFGDLWLQPGSPCIDAGDNTAGGLVGVTTDLAGLPRFVDDPATDDTGNGTPPIVDMGAYEFFVCGLGANPEITRHPISQTQCAGQSVTFSLTVTGQGLTYQWMRDGINIDGATDSSLMISPVSADDAANSPGYQCLVMNTYGCSSTSDAAVLTVPAGSPPSILVQPVSQTKRVGESVVFSVTAEGEGLTYQWMKDGVNMEGETVSSLTIAAVSIADTANSPGYQCVVTSSNGCSVTSEAATLTVTNPLSPTLFFEQAVQLTAGGAPMELNNHAAPRLVDWDNDGDLDLLVAGGDGYIWVFRNSGTAAAPVFEAGEQVLANGVPIRKGGEYTGACFVDMNRDGRQDLIIAHSNTQIGYYLNQGTKAAPAFGPWSAFPGPSGELVLPDWCGARIDVGDWDGDGLNDLVTGEFLGWLRLFRNTGTATTPRFDLPAAQFHLRGAPAGWAYNTHPRLFDINQDGRLDLTFGINWGNFSFLVVNPNDPGLSFHSLITARDADGREFDIRALNGDDSIPDYADLNDDGVVDMISGGKNGKIFCLYGIPYTTLLNRIAEIMDAHPTDLGPALAADSSLREELFRLHQSMRCFVSDFIPGLQIRESVRDWYAAQVVAFPQYLRKQYLDGGAQPYVSSLAGQVWVNLLESMPDSAAHRLYVADQIGLAGPHRQLLQDFGTLFVENSQADAGQHRVLHDYLASLPRALWDAELVTIDYFLSPAVGIQARMGVNVYANRVGQDQQNSFPPDSEPGMVDVFSVAVARQINHTVEEHTISPNPVLNERKYSLAEQASPPEVVFLDHATGLGVDWNATKSRFQTAGYWNGNDADWGSAWNQYWQTGPGSTYKENWLPNDLQWVCEATYQAFATLSNQYFTNSETMLDLSLRRWNRGIRSCINQFLFFADVYSQGTDTTYLYRMDTAGTITRKTSKLHRNDQGFIDRMQIGCGSYWFGLDEQGNVLSVDWVPVAPEDQPSISVQPVSQTKRVGESVVFSVTAAGEGLTYQWMEDGVNMEGETASSLTIAAVSIADAANSPGYQCVVSSGNGCSVTSEAATLTVEGAGRIFAVGSNSDGALGIGGDTWSPRASLMQSAVAVASRSNYSLVLKNDGTVWTWGYNYYGQLGDGTTVNRSTPVRVLNLAGIVAVSAGGYHGLALKADGTVWAWGRNDSGQLGDGTTTNRSTPVQVQSLTEATAIAGGGSYSLALKNDGTVWTWGYNYYGQLGDGTTTSRLVAGPVLNVAGVTSIAGGNSHSLALKADGTVWAWGHNYYGQLGDGTTTSRSVAGPVLNVAGVTSIAGGNSHNLALKADGTVWTWGYNSDGQLGDGTTTNRSTPVQAQGLTGVSGLAAGNTHSLAVENDGTVWAWGYNHYGQLGNGTVADRATAVEVQSPRGVTAVAGGAYHSLALKADGTVWAWGRNTYSQLGDGTTSSRISAVRLPNLDGVTAVACGYYHSLALKNDGTVWAWGWGGYGQLGDGTTTNRSIPVQVQDLAAVIAIASGDYHCLAVKNDGTVWAWGYNYYGQLGDGTTTNRPIPVQVQDLTAVTAIAGGEYHSLALKSDGTVWAWGRNHTGQLGDGTTTDHRSAAQVANLADVTAIDAGSIHSLALRADSTVWAWGYNYLGQLGDGTTTNRGFPVQALNLSGVTAIAGGGYHNLTIDRDGAVWAWGNNNNGQLGDGTAAIRSSPVRVLDVADAVAIAGGSAHSLFVSTASCPALPAPTAAAASRATLCIGGSVQLSATPGAGGDTVEWFVNGCGGVLVGTGVSITATPDANTLYFARTKDTATECFSSACVPVGPVYVQRPPSPDFDGDCDVDTDDLQVFEACATGPAIPYNAAVLPEQSPGCTLTPDGDGKIPADFDKDGDVDQTDFGIFQRCFSGSGNAADPGCAYEP